VWRTALPGSSGWLLGGVATAQLGLEEVTLAAQEQHPGSIALLDSAGRLVYGRGPGIDAIVAGHAAHIPATGSAETTFHFQGGQEYITTRAPVRGTDWQLMLHEPWHGMAAPMIRFEEAMPAVLLIAVAVSFLTLLFGLLFVVRPLQVLSERTRQIGLGNYAGTGSRVGGVDEIEELHLALEQMAQQVQSSQAGLERYLHAVTRAQEDERLRLARELHDETVQTLIAVDHKAQKVQRDLERDPERARAEVAELRRMAASATAEVRRFSRALRPVYLEDLGLAPALELLANESGAGFTLVGDPRRLAPDTELALYRIAQESLSNARRHAQAEQIEVTLAFQPGQVRLTVCDDGIGFEPPTNPAALTRSGHFGLMGMHERALLAGVHLDIQSTPDQGTAVVVTSSE
jgi:signal transduction histidine kinase